jgi:hypothetical protein
MSSAPAPTPIRLGLDFDNTIVLYDRIFQILGIEAGLPTEVVAGGKRAVRDHIRSLLDGEVKWTALQAKVYGLGIAQAEPSTGLMAFLARCRISGVELSIVSHKTEFAAADPDGVNLRAAAWRWIDVHGLTDPARGGIPPERVFFESTRAEKIARIRSLGCTHFVDDLDEVFRDPGFPSHVHAYLFAPAGGALPTGAWHATHCWTEIADDLFDRRAA